MKKQTKQLWEHLGASNPYYAVGTFDKYRRCNLDADLKTEFFESGREHVEHIWDRFEKSFGISLRPRRSLDYGCGVGRILVSLAEKSIEAVGVDISSTMLREAGQNCENFGLSNVSLRDASEFLDVEQDEFDFVHSFIVLQHIKPELGFTLIRKMTSVLDDGGAGMLHVTFHDPASRLLKLRTKLYLTFPGAHRMLCKLRGKDAELIPIHEYDLGRVFRILRENDCGEIFVEFTHHGLIGAMIYFRKSTGESH
jgi:2-polyprenyl-3-methyl-5-hydroxy-6-metoxy-1,4-benzoquinol methylase